MERPIFVVGSMGSGTTLTRLMLDSHPDLMIAPETGFMRSVNAQLFVPFWRFGDQWASRIELEDDEFLEEVRNFYDSVFSRAAAKRGARRWGDKTPFHVHHIATAARVFPDAQFVATVRHPVAVGVSLRRFHWSWSRGIGHWRKSNQTMIDQGIDLGERFHLIRYEDLVLEPERVMREVMSFLDVPWSDQVLRHHEVQGSRRAEGGTRTDRPIDANRLAAWQEQVDARELDRFAAATAAQARMFGYDPRQPLPIASLNPNDSEVRGVNGNELRDILAQFQPIDRVDVTPGFENELYTPKNLAEEIRAAYQAGLSGGRVRPAYREIVEDGLGTPNKGSSFSSRARRKLARMLHPEWN